MRYSVQGLALVAVVLALVAGPRTAALVKGLEIAPLRWMGRRSYAAYLWHITALSIGGLVAGFHGAPEAASRMQQLEAMPIVLALTWLFAELSYRFVFSPAQRLRRSPRPARGSSRPAREVMPVDLVGVQNR